MIVGPSHHSSFPIWGEGKTPGKPASRGYPPNKPGGVSITFFQGWKEKGKEIRLDRNHGLFKGRVRKKVRGQEKGEFPDRGSWLRAEEKK